MLSSILPDKPPFIATPPRKTPSWHKRSCAALARRDDTDVAVAVRTGQHAGGSANSRRNQTSSSSWATTSAGCSRASTIKRPDGRRNAQHRPHRTRRRQVHGLLRRAELHGRAQRLLHRHEPAAHGHDPAAAAGQPDLPAARARRRSRGSCATSATTPASSARTTWATTPTRCRPPTASTSSGAICTTWMRCRA